MILLIFIGKIAYNDFVVSIFDYKFVFQLGGSVTPDTPDYRGPGGEDVTATGGMDFISAPTSGGASGVVVRRVGKQVHRFMGI